MSDVAVLARTQIIKVNPASSTVSVVFAGPVGPTGAAGVSGDGDAATFTDGGGYYDSNLVGPALQEIGVFLETKIEIEDEDPTTGRVLANGLELGDTGWWNVDDGVLRRCGCMVFWTGTTTPPNGFRDSRSIGGNVFPTDDDWPSFMTGTPA